ncbi:MAG: DNA repair protein RecO [Oscillospiraceae bacterium]|nr:DNA repair protein RecO [Oscillospiraceae bacterium]
MYIRTEGLIVMEQNIGEKDKLLTILTKCEGLIRVFARGVKSFLNRNASATQLFCYSDLILYKTKDKYVLTEASAKVLFFDLRNDIEKLSLAEYFCELTIALTSHNHEIGDILSLILNSFHYLQTGKICANLLKPIFEIKILCFSGYTPNLICCKDCAAYCASTFYWILKEGSIFCENCFKNHFAPGLTLHSAPLAALRHIIYAEPKKTFWFELSYESKKELIYAAEQYILYCLEKELKTLDFYNLIAQN